MTVAELNAKYTGRKTISARAACGHTIYAETNHGVQDRTSNFRADAKTVVCTPCERTGATPTANAIVSTPQSKTPATSNQIKFARQLVRQHQGEYTANGQIVSPKMLEGISKDGCSQLINDLLTNR